VTGDELAALLADDAVTLVDVRSPGEFTGDAGYPCDPRQGHIPGAVNVDVGELLDAEPGALPALLAARGADPARPIVVYCHSGSRSASAASALRAAGLDAANYEGSWHEWSRRPAG
jgi:thiosulfate/3-mercaptopyruvate sulfurtransferase